MMRKDSHQQNKTIKQQRLILILLIVIAVLSVSTIILIYAMNQKNNSAAENAATSSTSTAQSTSSTSLGSTDLIKTSSSTTKSSSATVPSSSAVTTPSSSAQDQPDLSAFPYRAIIEGSDYYFTSPNSYISDYTILVSMAPDLNPSSQVNSAFTTLFVYDSTGKTIQTYYASNPILENTKEIRVLWGPQNNEVKTVSVNTAIHVRDMYPDSEKSQFALWDSIYLYNSKDGKMKLAIRTPTTFENAEYQELTATN